MNRAKDDNGDDDVCHSIIVYASEIGITELRAAGDANGFFMHCV